MIYRLITVVFALAVAATGAAAQGKAVKQNVREQATGVPAAGIALADGKAEAEAVRYFYEFSQPEFHVHKIRIEHDAAGRGRVSFERRGDSEPIVEPLEFSAAALQRIASAWEALRFLDSDASYQSSKQFPHLGTMRLSMKRGGRERTTEFNWSDDPNASALASEYRRAAEQSMFVFEMEVARENQPLEAPKLMRRLEAMLNRNGVSDPQQLVPFLRDLETDERIPLIARNHAGRLLKKIDKTGK